MNSHRSLTFNIDEFFVLLSSHTGRWTWHRCSERRTVALRDTKLGFTMAVLTSSDGKVHGLQMIWEGSTTRCHADDNDDPHPLIWQDHQPESQFQCSATWLRFMDKFFEIVEAIRVGVNGPACLIVDAAPQHALDKETVRRCVDHGVFLVRVPEKMTHVYQPADMFIIKTIKEKMNLAFTRYVRTISANYPADEAIVIMFTKNTTYLRKVKYEFLRQAVDSTSQAVVLKSWEETGILRVSFEIPLTTPRPIPYDLFCEQAGNNVIVIDDAAMDVDEDDDLCVISDDNSVSSSSSEEAVDTLDISNLLPVYQPPQNVPDAFIMKEKDSVGAKAQMKKEKNNRTLLMKDQVAERQLLQKDITKQIKKAEKNAEKAAKKKAQPKKREEDPHQPKMSFTPRASTQSSKQ